MNLDEALTQLGATAENTPEQLKTIWRKLCMIHHPDRGGNQVEFQKIQDAYNVADIAARKPAVCTQCSGSGRIVIVHGIYTLSINCTVCYGSGKFCI